MEGTYNSEETVAPSKFGNINQYPENISAKQKQKAQSTSGKQQESHGRKVQIGDASGPESGQKSDNPVKRFFRNATKRTKNFWKRVKEKLKCGGKKKSNDDIDQNSTRIAGYPDPNDTTARNRRQGGRSRRRKKKRTADTAQTSDVSLSSRTHPADRKDKFCNDHVLGKDFPDFTKSCCYLCANAMTIAGMVSNNLEKSHASIQASSSFKDKLDKSCSPVSYVRTVKSSVKVKVRNIGTHYPEEKKSTNMKFKLQFKKFKDKVLFKQPNKLKTPRTPSQTSNIPETPKTPKPSKPPKPPKPPKSPKPPKTPKTPQIPKMLKTSEKPKIPKTAKSPNQHTVACETDTATKYTNTPQCMVRRGIQCVREEK